MGIIEGGGEEVMATCPCLYYLWRYIGLNSSGDPDVNCSWWGLVLKEEVRLVMVGKGGWGIDNIWD